MVKKKKDNFIYFILFVFLVIVLDQISKFFALRITEKIVLLPNILSFNLVHNTGAAFGILKGLQFFLGIINLLVVFFIFYLYYKKKIDFYLPFACIVGGALGNAIDRFFYAGVIDFIDLGWWPVFNIADSFIFIGVLLLIFYEIKKSYFSDK